MNKYLEKLSSIDSSYVEKHWFKPDELTLAGSSELVKGETPDKTLSRIKSLPEYQHIKHNILKPSKNTNWDYRQDSWELSVPMNHSRIKEHLNNSKNLAEMKEWGYDTANPKHRAEYYLRSIHNRFQ